MATVTICSDFGAQENKICHSFYFSCIYLPWNDRPGCNDISECWVLSQLFHFPFLPSSRGSLFSAIRVVLSAYLRLLIFFLAILIIDILSGVITADGDCSHEIKRHLLLERKVITNVDSILKSRGITLPTKVCLVKAMVFPVVVYGCESWTIKKAEHRRIDGYWTVVLE